MICLWRRKKYATANIWKSELSDLGVNYGSIAADDWDNFVAYSKAKIILQER
jgi:hypothetical protein